MMKHGTITILMLLFCTTLGLADGKMYVPPETVPLGIPYQRALILHQEGKQTMVLQSKFETSETLPADSIFGWVVPLPSVPELASMDAFEADQLFDYLSWESAPEVTQISYILMPIILLAIPIIPLILFLWSSANPQSRFAKHRTKLLLTSMLGVYLLFFISLFATASMSAYGRGVDGVEVLQSGQVGIYNTKVIRSDSSEALIAWLNDNGFQFTPSDAPVVESYIKQGWCFVVAKVRPGEDMEFHSGEGGLLDPLILRFKSESAIYPLALTSTIGVDTEVLLYVMSDRKMECGGRMKLLYAAGVDADFLTYNYSHGMDDKKNFRPWETSLKYLCKFKSKLTPEEMKTDLILTPAKDNDEYRAHIIKW